MGWDVIKTPRMLKELVIAKLAFILWYPVHYLLLRKKASHGNGFKKAVLLTGLAYEQITALGEKLKSVFIFIRQKHFFIFN